MSSGFVLEEVSVVHGAARILDEVSASLPAKRCAAIVGPSGSGKSTLLRLLNRLAEPTTGRVLLDGTPLPSLDVLGLRRRVALVAQRPVMLADRVGDDVRVGRPELTPDSVAGLLGRVGLDPDMAERRTDGLSGGEAQRVCLARTLAVEPQVLLLDEPTSALDGVNVAVVTGLARRFVADGGTVILVSHDLDIVRHVADTVLVIERGRLVSAGRPGEVDYLEAR